MNVRITPLDGKLPNLALMRLASFHRENGDQVTVTRSLTRELGEPKPDVVYGSAIFNSSFRQVEDFRKQFPDAIIGGTGSGNWQTVEEIIGQEWLRVDYSDYPNCDASIGYTMQGCRFKCEFCIVPKKEGKPRATSTILDIWRGGLHSRKLLLLDSDFFGQPEGAWRKRIDEIRTGGFRVCLEQGINIRTITDTQAASLASIEYRCTKFQRRRLYCAWDRLRDERRFFDGVDRLDRAGIPPHHLRAYMLIGHDQEETIESRLYRFNRMVERGIEPYPMPIDRKQKDLMAFSRWAATGLYRAVPWKEYRG
ncbi:MAG: hypothetical protein HQL07_00550 [Nitrospirae bacterium]|nr:hypothetical protein [Magnetococcales bacterium]